MLICVACFYDDIYAKIYSSKQGGFFMLNENLKTLRKNKGYSQEQLAVRLNVVRQTVSKW